MSVIIRLQNLPWSANAHDIREFFKGLAIPEGGVHIVGGEMGDAFIAFSSDEDARLAMQKTGSSLKSIQISLLLSSRSEMQKVIETARQQAMGIQSFIPTPAPIQQATQMPQVPQVPQVQQMPQVPQMPQIPQVPMQQSQFAQPPPSTQSAPSQSVQRNQGDELEYQNPPNPNYVYQERNAQNVAQLPTQHTQQAAAPYSYNSQVPNFMPNQMGFQGQRFPSFPPGVVPPPGMPPQYYGQPPPMTQPSVPTASSRMNEANNAGPQGVSQGVPSNMSQGMSQPYSSAVQQPQQPPVSSSMIQGGNAGPTGASVPQATKVTPKDRKPELPSSVSGRDKRERDKGRDERRKRSKSRSRSRDRDRRRRHRSRSRSRSRDRSGRRRRSRSRERERPRDKERERTREREKGRGRDRPEKEGLDHYEGAKGKAPEGPPAGPTLAPAPAVAPGGIPGLGEIPDDIPKEGLSIFSAPSNSPVQTKEPLANSGWSMQEPIVHKEPQNIPPVAEQAFTPLPPKPFLLANPPMQVPQVPSAPLLPLPENKNPDLPYQNPPAYQNDSLGNAGGPAPMDIEPTYPSEIETLSNPAGPPPGGPEAIRRDWGPGPFDTRRPRNEERPFRGNDAPNLPPNDWERDDWRNSPREETNQDFGRSIPPRRENDFPNRANQDDPRNAPDEGFPPDRRNEYPPRGQGFQEGYGSQFDDRPGRGSFRGRGRRGGFGREGDRDMEYSRGSGGFRDEEPGRGERGPPDFEPRPSRGGRGPPDFEPRPSRGERGPPDFEPRPSRGERGPPEFDPRSSRGERGPPELDPRSGRGFLRGRGGRMPPGGDFLRDRRVKSHSVEVLHVPHVAGYGIIRNLFTGIHVPPDSIKILGDQYGKRIGVALLRFDTTRDAFEAVKMSGKFLFDSKVQINFVDDGFYDEAKDISYFSGPQRHHPKAPEVVNSPCIYVSGLPVGCTDHDVGRVFESFKVEEIILELERGSRQPSGGCFVKFGSPNEAQEVCNMKNANVDGTPIRIERCPTEAMENAGKERDRIRNFSKPPQQKTAPKYNPPEIGTTEHIKAITQHLLKSAGQKFDTKNGKNSSDENNDNESSGKTGKKSNSNKAGVDLLTDSVVVKNVSSDITETSIRDFFSDEGLIPEKVYFNRPDSEGKCDVFVIFPKVEEAKRAIDKNKQQLGATKVTVELISKPTVMLAMGLPFNPLELFQKGASETGNDHPMPVENAIPTDGGKDGGFRGPNNHILPNPRFDTSFRGRGGYGSRFPRMHDPSFGGYRPRNPYQYRNEPEGNYNPERKFEPRGVPNGHEVIKSPNPPEDFGKKGCVVALANVPYMATTDDILAFFRDFTSLKPENIIRRYDELNRPTADSRVALPTPEDAKKAIDTLHTQLMLGRPIYMSLVD